MSRSRGWGYYFYSVKYFSYWVCRGLLKRFCFRVSYANSFCFTVLCDRSVNISVFFMCFNLSFPYFCFDKLDFLGWVFWLIGWWFLFLDGHFWTLNSVFLVLVGFWVKCFWGSTGLEILPYLKIRWRFWNYMAIFVSWLKFSSSTNTESRPGEFLFNIIYRFWTLFLLAIFSAPSTPIFKIIRTNPHSFRVLLIHLLYFFRIDYFDGVFVLLIYSEF